MADDHWWCTDSHSSFDGFDSYSVAIINRRHSLFSRPPETRFLHHPFLGRWWGGPLVVNWCQTSWPFLSRGSDHPNPRPTDQDNVFKRFRLEAIHFLINLCEFSSSRNQEKERKMEKEIKTRNENNETFSPIRGKYAAQQQQQQQFTSDSLRW